MLKLDENLLLKFPIITSSKVYVLVENITLYGIGELMTVVTGVNDTLELFGNLTSYF